MVENARIKVTEVCARDGVPARVCWCVSGCSWVCGWGGGWVYARACVRVCASVLVHIEHVQSTCMTIWPLKCTQRNARRCAVHTQSQQCECMFCARGTWPPLRSIMDTLPLCGFRSLRLILIPCTCTGGQRVAGRPTAGLGGGRRHSSGVCVY